MVSVRKIAHSRRKEIAFTIDVTDKVIRKMEDFDSAAESILLKDIFIINFCSSYFFHLAPVKSKSVILWHVFYIKHSGIHIN